MKTDSRVNVSTLRHWRRHWKNNRRERIRSFLVVARPSKPIREEVTEELDYPPCRSICDRHSNVDALNRPGLGPDDFLHPTIASWLSPFEADVPESVV